MHAPDDYTFDRVSASQIKKFKRCKRLWFFQYPLGRKPEPTDAMLYGIAAHDDIENYIETGGELHELEAVEIQERGFIPPRDECIPELSFRKEIIDGVDISGRIDLVHVDSQGRPVVTDWKFRSSIGREMYDNDILQLMCYGWAFPGITGLKWDNDEFVLRIVESLKEHKGGPAAKERRLVKSREEIEEYVDEEIRPAVREMREVAEKRLPEIYPVKRHDRDVCYKYGTACPHLDHCDGIDYEHDEPIGIDTTKEDEMDLKRLIGQEAQKEQQEEETSETSESNEPEDGQIQPDNAEPDRQPKGLDQSIKEFDWESIDGMGPATKENLLKQLEEEGYETIRELHDDTYPYDSVPKIGPSTASNIRKAIKTERNFEPEEDTEENSENTEYNPGKVEKLSEFVSAAKDLMPEGYEWDKSLVSEGELARCEEPEHAKNMMVSKIDKEGSENSEKDEEKSLEEATKEASEQAAEVTGNPADPVTMDSPQDGGSSQGSDDDRMVLCINCEPQHNRGEYRRLYNMLQPLKEELAEDLGVQHWNAADFREGEQKMGLKVLEHIDRFDGEKIVCEDDSYPGMKQALEYLLRRADEVYKG